MTKRLEGAEWCYLIGQLPTAVITLQSQGYWSFGQELSLYVWNHINWFFSIYLYLIYVHIWGFGGCVSSTSTPRCMSFWNWTIAYPSPSVTMFVVEEQSALSEIGGSRWLVMLLIVYYRWEVYRRLWTQYKLCRSNLVKNLVRLPDLDVIKRNCMHLVSLHALAHMVLKSYF